MAVAEVKKPPMRNEYSGLYLRGPRLEVDDEFRSLFPAVDRETDRDLIDGVEREGFVNPIVAWVVDDRLVILDGHRRYGVAISNDWPYPVIRAHCKTRREAYELAVQLQTTRRNLTPTRLAEYRTAMTKQIESDPSLDKTLARQQAAKILKTSRAELKLDREVARVVSRLDSEAQSILRESDVSEEIVAKLNRISGEAGSRVVKASYKSTKGAQTEFPTQMKRLVAEEIRRKDNESAPEQKRDAWKVSIDKSYERLILALSGVRSEDPRYSEHARRLADAHLYWKKISE